MEHIVGIGVDQIEIERVLQACDKKGFLKKYFSEDEQCIIKKKRGSAATNFAGKEAVVKALGTGFLKIAPAEVEILRKEDGAPFVRLSGNAKKRSAEMGITTFHISLSDSQTLATAFVIASTEKSRLEE